MKKSTFFLAQWDCVFSVWGVSSTVGEAEPH